MKYKKIIRRHFILENMYSLVFEFIKFQSNYLITFKHHGMCFNFSVKAPSYSLQETGYY